MNPDEKEPQDTIGPSRRPNLSEIEEPVQDNRPGELPEAEFIQDNGFKKKSKNFLDLDVHFGSSPYAFLGWV